MDELLLKSTGIHVCALLAPAGRISQTRGPNKGRLGHTAPPRWWLHPKITAGLGDMVRRGLRMDEPGAGSGGWALLSQDSPSGLLRDDPNANKTFLKSLVQKSKIYLAGTVSLYKVSPS